MASSESPADTEVNARLRELADIFAGALLRLRPSAGPCPECSANPPGAAFSPLEVPPETALGVPDGLPPGDSENQERRK